MESRNSERVSLDISFGFNNPNFSDRTLLLQIIGKDDDDDVDITLSNRRVKAIHVDSLILAARSPFFRKLFSNGMRESEQKHVTLRIKALEEISFMELLKYIYSNNLPTNLEALLDLLLTAEKFEVDSCLRDCIRALQNNVMTCELASMYLNLPSNLLMSPRVQPLIDVAKNFLVAKFNDISTFNEDVLNLSLPSFQTVISSDDLRVNSESDVFDLVLEWIAKHYPDLEERREILKEHLLHLVRFPFMTTTELTEQVQTCSYIDPELSSRIVNRALSFKAETSSNRKRRLATAEDSTASRQFVKRAYKYRPIKVVELEQPHPQCLVFLDLTRNELKRIATNGYIWSETFHLDAFELDLCVKRTLDQINFGLILETSESSTCTIKYEFAVRRKPEKIRFESWSRGSHTFTSTEFSENLHGVEWTRFIGDNSPYFINDTLHLRAELTIEK